MKVTVRPYDRDNDYKQVSEFLLSTYGELGKPTFNWLQPRWEYMHYHPYTDSSLYPKIGIFEEASKIVGVVTFEMRLESAFINIAEGYDSFKKNMLEYAESNLKCKKDNKQFVKIFANSFDLDFINLLTSKGYDPLDHDKPWYEITQFNLQKNIEIPALPNGYNLHSLAEEYDVFKVDRVLWRGFGHEGEPDPSKIHERELMHSAPNFNKALNYVVTAPNGNYVAYSGIWFDAHNKIAYVEPVATDPDYRRKGLAKAAVLGCLNSVKQLGARYALVGSGLEFYHAIGFKHLFYRQPYIKYFK